jgi:type VI protein secretion system component Hcp
MLKAWKTREGKMNDYFEYMLQNEMERIESIADAIEADSAEVEQLPEVEINWETMENF